MCKEREDGQAVVTRVSARYLELMRKVQKDILVSECQP